MNLSLSSAHPTILHELISTSPSLRPRSKSLYIDGINRYVAFAGAEPEGWTLSQTRAFYRHLLDTKMKPQSANNIMKAVAFAGKWYAIEVGKPESDFSRIQLAPDKLREQRDAFTEGQAKALLDTCREHTPKDVRDFALMVTALETGMRRMSLAGMEWDKIKHAPPAVAVPLKGYDEPYSVPLSDTAVAALDLWRGWLDTKRVLKKGPVWRALTNNLAGTSVGGGVSTTSIYNIIRDRTTLIGIEAYPHVFRHTFITWRKMAGVPDHLISAISAHRLRGEDPILHGYTDKRMLAEKARKTTPAWLVAYVADYCKQGVRA